MQLLFAHLPNLNLLCYNASMVDTRFSVSVHIMLYLAHHQHELMNSESLADLLKTNSTFIRKLVSRLVDAKLVDSFRGKGGGIKLALDPKEISLKDIYLAATEEKTLMSAHKKPITKSCPISCNINNILGEVVDGVENTTCHYLSKMHLSDLLKKVAKDARS